MATITISVQRYAHDGPQLTWETGSHHLADDAARRHRDDLTRRRRNRNLVRLPDGIEFDTYIAGAEPIGCPEMAGSRTRVTFQF